MYGYEVIYKNTVWLIALYVDIDLSVMLWYVLIIYIALF